MKGLRLDIDVIPAEAGIQASANPKALDSRIRGNDAGVSRIRGNDVGVSCPC
jgi:hypothetical protein